MIVLASNRTLDVAVLVPATKGAGKRVRSNVPTSDLLWLFTSEIRPSSLYTRPTRAS